MRQCLLSLCVMSAGFFSYETLRNELGERVPKFTCLTFVPTIMDQWESLYYGKHVHSRSTFLFQADLNVG